MNLEKLKESRQGIWFIVDLFMMALLIINLILLLFDALYETQAVFTFLAHHFPAFIDIYQPVHDNFLFVDLCFISVFLAEFVLRWIVAVKNKEYMRWYFFPFIHWYDLIGCIPVESARIFRFLRIISILYRLHKYQIIDFKDWVIFRFLRFYYDVVIEELSDRIVAKIISDAQQEIASGSSLLDTISDEVIKPRKTVVTRWVATTAHYLGNSISHPEKGEVIRQHIIKSVAKAVRNDSQISLLNKIPVLGGNLEKRLEKTVSNVVIESITNMLEDLDEQTVEELINTGLNHFSKTEEELNNEILAIIIEVLEIVKQFIQEKRWQESLAERDAQKKRLVDTQSPVYENETNTQSEP